MLQIEGLALASAELEDMEDMREMRDYLASLDMLRDRYQLQHAAQEEAERTKRRWWGNKHKDNKAYGFWISALNKAGNYKRGKRGVPFVPAMSPVEADHNPFEGYPDYSFANELIPDKQRESENISTN